MKIKRKVEKNLPQLIEWAMDNNVDNSIFIGKKNLYNVGFNKNGLMYFNTTKPIPTGEIFTVETLEEITEKTTFGTLIQVTEIGNVFTIINGSVEEEKSSSTIEFHALVNGRLTLIWRDRRLVE